VSSSSSNADAVLHELRANRYQNDDDGNVGLNEKEDVFSETDDSNADGNENQCDDSYRQGVGR
jgi:hypothetical protein